MKPRNTLILVAIFAALLGYLYFVELNKTPDQISQALGTPTARVPQALFQLNVDDMTQVDLTDLRAGRQVQLKRANNQWQVVKPLAKLASDSEVVTALGEFAALKYTRVLTNVTNLGQYGFITATLEARVTLSNTQSYALTVGNKTPDGSFYYVVYTGDTSRVFLVSTTTIDTLQAWFDAPPYEPTPTPTFTPTLPVTPTVEATPPVTATTVITK